MKKHTDPKETELHRLFFTGKLSKEELDLYLNELAQGKLSDSFPTFSDLPEYFSNSDTTNQRAQVKLIRRNQWFIAASIFFLFFISLGIAKWSSFFNKQNQIVYKTIQVPINNKANITLNDGTKAEIAPGSTFRYPEKFSDSTRDVYVDHGKVYFDVTKNKDKPFIVHSADIETKVLGTSFSVENYSQAGFQKVNLYEGKIKILNTGSNKEHHLNPGQLYEWNKNTQTEEIEHFDVNQNPAIGTSLTFKQANLQAVLLRLGLLKGVKFEFKNQELEKYKITGSFDGMQLKEILKSITIIHPIKIIEIDSKTFQVNDK